MMYAVRIDKGDEPGSYVFKVSPFEGVLEMVALDSTPGIIAMVHANNPAHACERAWYKAEHMHDGDQDPQLVAPQVILAALEKP